MDEKATILAWLQGTLDTMQTEAEALWGRYNDHLAGSCNAREIRDLIRRSLTTAKTLEKFAAKLKATQATSKAA
jgi:chemotaxis regulatin CheY-phosphate phosphatase CheZ